MKIIITPFGSTGDVLPLLTLGTALKQNGHEVTVISSPNYENLFQENGLEFHCAGFDIKSTMEKYSEEIYGNFIKLIKTFSRLYDEFITEQFDMLLTLAQNGTDIIIGSGISVASRSAAEKLKIRYHQVCYYPNTYPSRYYPPTFISNQHLPYCINSVFWKFQNYILKKLFGESLNRLRKKQGLAELTDFTGHFNDNSILACNKSLISIPEDVDVNFLHTGYFFPEIHGEPDDAIMNFIGRSNKTIYIGFGSMTDPKPQKTMKLVREISKLTEYNFIISRGWAGICSDIKSDNILFIDHVPFMKLFPKISLVIHHGGAGTTLSAARSGVPQIIVPHMIDQFYWGRLIADLKIGGRPIKKSRLNFRRLRKSIEYIFNNPEISRNAEKLAAEMKKEDGLKSTMEFLERECAITKQNPAY